MKIEVNLVAYTRMDYYKEIEVPDDATEAEIDAAARQVQENTDGGEYASDNEYWAEQPVEWCKV